MNIIIRKATEKDSEDIINVNNSTWNTTYKGLIPDGILKKYTNNSEEKIIKIKKIIKEYDNFLIALDNKKVIGLISYGKSLNKEFKNSGEIYSLYLIKEYQGLGIGKKLFFKGIEELIKKGFDSMIINVLENNPTIKFYIKYSGLIKGEKQEKKYNYVLKEKIIYFDNLKEILLNK